MLYTGDFRLAVGDAARMEYLHSGDRYSDITYLNTAHFVDNNMIQMFVLQGEGHKECVYRYHIL